MKTIQLLIRAILVLTFLSFSFVDLDSAYINAFGYGSICVSINGFPEKDKYNAVIISPVASWREDGQDGGSRKTLFSLLMLNARDYNRDQFVSDKVLEEERKAAEDEEATRKAGIPLF